MVPTLIPMPQWSDEIEEELILLLKDWLKAQGRTQADLKKSLDAVSTRMPALLEVLKNEFMHGGLPKVAECLCTIEEEWTKGNQLVGKTEVNPQKKSADIDPFDQLDLLLEEIREDCEN